MGNIRYRYDTPVGGVRPVAMDYARYYNDGGPKKRTVINPEWEAFQNRLRQERFAENIAASRGEYWDKNWYDPNYKSGLYSFDDNGILTYQGQTYAPFGNSEKEGITVPVRTPHGISYGANVVYYPIEVPQQYIEEEYYEPEQEPQPEVAIEPPVNSPMVAKQKSAGKKIPTTQGQHDVDISFARFYKERGKDSIGKNRGNRTPFEDVSTEYENWVNKKLVDEYKIKYMSDDYKNYWRFHKDRANRDELNNTYVTYGGVKYILPFGASNKREDIWRGLYSEKDYAQYSKGTWQKEKRDKLGSMHGLFPSLATEIKINNQGDTISYRVLNPVTQSNLEPKKEYGHPSDFQNGSESIAGSRLGYNSWYQERTGYDKSVAGRVSENIKDYWSDGIGTGIKRMFSKNENEDGLIKKIRKASQYSKEGMPTLERIRKIFKANGGPLRHDRNYNTILPQGQESAYQQWVQTLPINLRSDYDYDLRGAWLNGDLPDENYHMSDRWKKPWHATFSDESVYSGDGAVGGHWYGDRFEPSALNRYVGGFRYGNWGAESFGDGGGIHIKKANRGKFTAAAERAGKSVQAYASQILANKGNYSPTLVKRANFARNAAKWHGYGGNLYGPGGVASPDDPPRKVDFFAGMSPMSAGYSGPAVVVADNTQRIVPVTQEKVAVQQSLADNKAATIAKEVADTDARRFGYANAEDRVEKEAYAAAVAAHEADMGEIRPYDGKVTDKDRTPNVGIFAASTPQENRQAALNLATTAAALTPGLSPFAMAYLGAEGADNYYNAGYATAGGNGNVLTRFGDMLFHQRG